MFGRAFQAGLSSLWDRAAARLAALRFNPSRKPFADTEKVSLGDGRYILGADANRLARMAREAENDTRPWIVLADLSPEDRAAIIAEGNKRYRIDLGECTREEQRKLLFGE